MLVVALTRIRNLDVLCDVFRLLLSAVVCTVLRKAYVIQLTEYYSSIMGKSAVWEHFTKSPSGPKCNICKSIVASKGGNTSNLATHLRRKHQLNVPPHPFASSLQSTSGEFK